jgi:protein gp37
VKGHPFEHGFDLKLAPHKLGDPLGWTSSKRVFVNSMSDLLHPGVPDDYIEKVARVMMAANWHTYQVLTKRASRLKSLLRGKLKTAAIAPNIWWGVSVENRVHGLPRINFLRDSGATVKFLSCEPLLEDLGTISLAGIDWVIVGGESGPGARPMHRAWVEGIRRQCLKSRVAFFFKQWGGVQKSRHGRQLNERTYDEFPTEHRAAIPTKARRDQMLIELVN